jgi:hypothetical protein
MSGYQGKHQAAYADGAIVNTTDPLILVIASATSMAILTGDKRRRR